MPFLGKLEDAAIQLRGEGWRVRLTKAHPDTLFISVNGSEQFNTLFDFLTVGEGIHPAITALGGDRFIFAIYRWQIEGKV